MIFSNITISSPQEIGLIAMPNSEIQEYRYIKFTKCIKKFTSLIRDPRYASNFKSAATNFVPRAQILEKWMRIEQIDNNLFKVIGVGVDICDRIMEKRPNHWFGQN